MTHKFNDTKSKIIFCLQSKNFPPDKQHPGHRSRYGKYGPRSGYGFLRTACQPIRIENFEKPYNNKYYSRILHVRKYNELNRRDGAQININSDKNIIQ
jgi:hypothetical protein